MTESEAAAILGGSCGDYGNGKIVSIECLPVISISPKAIAKDWVGQKWLIRLGFDGKGILVQKQLIPIRRQGLLETVDDWLRKWAEHRQ
jgi:hypothetical protein